MVEKKLRIFVSGKEDELFNERIIANDTIESFEFLPEGSENRSASDDPIESEFLEEVRTSHIYVGIFGDEYSSPSIKEFETARTYQIPTLIFVRNLKKSRDVKLTEFIDKVQESQTGIVYKNFNNVLELQKELKKSLSQILSKRFTKFEEFRKENEELKNKLTAKKSSDKTLSTQDRITDTSSIQIIPPKNLAVTPSLEYGRIKIQNFIIPQNIVRGKKFSVSASIKGKTRNGFLDLVLISPDDMHYWIPDPTSWNSINDNGTLEFDDDIFSASWLCEIPPNWEVGKYRAVMGIYENKAVNRKLLHYLENEVTVS
ncbi:MAG: DUF4062 domain-containing protein [Candidatus Nitrosopumilus sp. bin_7KS]